MRKPEWYFDEDVIGVAKVLTSAKLAVTWPGDSGERPSARLCQVPSPVLDAGRPDEEWIPRVARAGLPIVTRDRHILTRTVEVDAVIAAGARMFTITSAGAQSLWEQVQVIAAQWGHMQRRREQAGPYIDGITLTAARQLYPPSPRDQVID